ncbi:MAG TPA: hypothetical protein VFF53_12910 [Geobacteraceae bacterium]|nr:hypothetical protein [Geobacteraceae bacterium]
MPSGFDFKKLSRLIKIYAVVQVALVALLLYVALLFQTNLGPLFWKSILITLVIQLVNFYPVNLFATREARREVAATAIGLTPEELKAQRQQRLVGDVLKMAVFGFFIIFAYKAPVTANVQANRFYQSLIFFNFILTYLSYFQCFNFAAKREMKERS